jgi:hypothetical protein
MRTTLDIDDDVLEAAKELAKAEKKTAGQVVSDLARRGLAAPDSEKRPAPEGLVLKNGFYMLTGREGLVVTNELVDRIEEEIDLEDAGIVIPETKRAGAL